MREVQLSENAGERRKTVCRTLTTVLERSTVAQRVDARAFYMLIRANYEVLNRDGIFDLTPLWASMTSELGDDPALPGLFIGLEESIRPLGMPPRLPDEVARLSSGDRVQAVETAFPEGPPTTDLGGLTTIETGDAELDPTPARPDVPIDDLGLGPTPTSTPPAPTSTSAAPTSSPPAPAVDEPPPALQSGDLVPLMPEDRRRAVINAVVKGVRASPARDRIDGAQIAYQLDARFDELCDGERLDFGPLLRGFRDLEGFEDRDLYVGLVQMQGELGELGIELLVPRLDVSDVEASILLDEARGERAVPSSAASRDLEAILEGRTERARARENPRRSGDLPAAGAKREGWSKREERLARYHLLGLDDARVTIARRVLLVLLVIGLGAAAWVFRPTRPLDSGGYPLPLTSAKLEEGEFQGFLDDDAWYRLPVQRRADAVSAMSDALAARGFLANAVIIDDSGRIVAKVNEGRLTGSRWLLESPDGTRPPPQGDILEPGKADWESDAEP